MSKNVTPLINTSQLLPMGTQGKIRIRPFKGSLLTRLIAEFKSRNCAGEWCGYAMLEEIPEKLHSFIDTTAKYDNALLCAVMFLKGSSSHNYLFQTDEHGFILFNQDLNLLHAGPSLCDALDKAQNHCYRN